MGLLLAASSGATQDLEAGGIATSAPTVGSPTIGQAHALVAGSIATAAPTVGAPTIGEGGGASSGPSQDFKNVLDGPGERYWNDRRKRDRETREKRDRERIEALERELAELDRVEEPKPEPDAVPAKAKLKRLKPVRKPLEPIETPELLAAMAQAQLQAALLAEQQRLFDEEAAIILLLAA
jgi:hypothetical protein